ncbi:DMT family transporter [Mesorhizobium sp. M0152]|uniref:EamA family transporter n=1 Tax=unclassified Mesorhizobium TaxID=325217 RepID=UPI00333CBD15
MDDQTQAPVISSALGALDSMATKLPPHVWFGISAVFHYLGPAFAVLLFPHVGVLGMAWLRIATAALIFAPLTRPWRTLAHADRPTRLLLLAFGACLAVMNCSFYLALDRLPISLVAAIEFVGTIGVALIGFRSPRNLAALAVAVVGTLLLIDIKWSSDPLGLFWAFLNGALFVGYIVLGHKVARAGAGIAGLGAAMAIAFITVLPIGLAQALPAFSAPQLLLAAVGVGICSSVIPYICDQLAMSRLPRSSFALMLSLLPVTATLIGVIVLRQIPDVRDCLGIALVVAGVAAHKPANTG